MTGFSRLESTHTWGTLSWEIRSVNHRYLEPTFRLPDIFRAIEPILRQRLRKKLQRGKVEMSLHLNRETEVTSELAIDEELLNKISHAIRKINASVDQAAPTNAIDILKWPGVVNSETIDTEDLHNHALALFDDSLKQLIDHRAREGKELSSMIEQRLTAVLSEVQKVRKHLPELLAAQRLKFTDKLDALDIDNINQDRLEQELVIHAQKADVAEELDRLEAHVLEVQHTLQQKGPIGRRLDFLMQEFNREANTLSSKSIAGETTQAAVELKILIEQMREQIQNIE
ncbi:MAG: YicC/YloC family endoribonuclease [Cellvibrionaceae bacterium]